MFTIVDEDIFNAKEDYLCHQCNCVTTRAAHMAEAVFKNYPYSDIYTDREDQSKPGTIVVCGKGRNSGERLVVNMLGQYYPGTVAYEGGKVDGREARLMYFRKCLWEMAKTLSGSFAFPWTVGCGAAGGDWGAYIGVLKAFESYIPGDVVIYRLPEKKKKRKRK